MVIKRVAMALTAILLLLTLAGCTGRTVVISWSPNPIVVNEGDTQIKGKVTIRTTGTLSSLRIDTVKAEVVDEDGNVDPDKTWTFKVNRTLPIFVNIDITEEVTLNVSYDDVIDNDVSKVRITVTGSDPGVLEVKVNAQANNKT